MVSGLGKKDIINALITNFSCPIKWGGVLSDDSIFHQKWYYTVASFLPNGTLDADVLKDECGNFLLEPCSESFCFLDNNDLKSLYYNSEQFKNEYSKQYFDSCINYNLIKAQTPSERNKHYPGKIRDIKVIEKLSRDYKEIGYLLPNLDPEKQLSVFWIAMHYLFENKECEIREEGALMDNQIIFEKTWESLLDKHRFRICIDTMTTVGYYGGEEANWLIYDTSVSGHITHCYPSLEPLSNAPMTALDDLQGLKSAFINDSNFSI